MPEMEVKNEVKCGHCGVWFLKTLDACPYCGTDHAPPDAASP